MRFTEFLKLQEMAMSKGDPAKVRVDMDQEDRDFIQQAVQKGVTPGSAITARYTTLLQMKPQGDDPIEIKFSGPGGGKKVMIQRPHYLHLVKKLRDLGLNNAAENGLEAMSRPDAKNFIDGRKDKATGESKGNFLVVNHMTSRNPEAAAFSKDWGQKSAWEGIEKMWQEKGTLNDSPGYDDVMQDVEKLVGTQIKPEVWEKFKEGIDKKGYLRTIVNVVTSTLRQVEETDTIADRTTFKTVLRQVIAKMLIWGGMTANDPKHPLDLGKMVIELPAWVNNQSRIETSWVVRHWFNKRLDKYARAFQAGKEHDASDLADLGKQVVGRASPTSPEDELEPDEMPQSIADRISPTQQMNIAPPRPQQDFDYAAWQKQQDQEAGEDDIAAYRRKRAGAAFMHKENTNEVAGATGVVSPKPGKDYQIEGDPVGSAKSMKSFKQYLKDKK